MALGDDISDSLHFRKNRPAPIEVGGKEIEYPPYQYREYPRAMYHATDPRSPIVAQDEDEFRRMHSRGWRPTSPAADAQERQREEDVATAAAERAYDDRRLSAPAKAEVDAYEAATEDFVPEKPEAPKPPKPTHRKTTS